MRHLLARLQPGAWLLMVVTSWGCQSSRPCCCNGCRKCCGPCTASAARTGAPVVAQYPSLPAAGPVKHVATYPPLPPIVSTKELLSASSTPPKAAGAPVSSAADAWVQRVPAKTAFAPPSAAANAWVQPVQSLTTATAKAKVRKPQPMTVVSAKTTIPADSVVPAGARYGHDANYHYLVGTLEYSRIQEAWVLRYVSYEEEDRYGGCVTLVAPGRGITLKDGQTVRVEGALIDPNSQQLRPAFEVRAIRATGS